MTLTINNEIVETPSESMTITELLEWRNVRQGGTAVAMNNRLVRNNMWESTKLSDGDAITIISAAFGG